MTVIIVGAGPAGASLAYVLASRGAGVVLLERQTDFSREFRGEALMPSGVDALRQMGLGADLDALPHSQARAFEAYLDGEIILSVDLPAQTGVAAGPRFVSQPALLEMLVARAGAFPSFRFERGFTVRNLVQEHGRVVGVRGDAQSGPQEVRADFVVGADGRASVARKRSGLDLPKHVENFDVMWCKLPIPPFLDGQDRARIYLGRDHFALMFQAPDRRLQIAWIIAKGTFGELRRRGIDEWVEELADHVSPDLSDHFRRNRGEIHHPFLLDVVCNHLDEWSAPGLLLLGDAAHPMSPVGAQGINVALRDSIVAANHLCKPLVGGAGADELDAAARRVRDERLPEIRVLQRIQRAMPRLIFQRSRFSRFVVSRVLPALAGTRIAPAVAGRAFRIFAQGTREVTLRV